MYISDLSIMKFRSDLKQNLDPDLSFAVNTEFMDACIIKYQQKRSAGNLLSFIILIKHIWLKMDFTTYGKKKNLDTLQYLPAIHP